MTSSLDCTPRFSGELIAGLEGTPLSLWRHNTLPRTVERISMAEIARVVASHFRVSVTTLRGPSQTDAACRARSVAARRMMAAGFSSTRVGMFLGGRDHSTILCIAKGRARRRSSSLRRAA